MTATHQARMRRRGWSSASCRARGSKAVSVNRVLRVRLNCPAAGYYPHGRSARHAPPTPRSTAACRRAYPFPPPTTDLMTRPNFDGPVRVAADRRDGDAASARVPARTARRSTSSAASPQTIDDAGDDHGHAQRQVENGDGQCMSARFSSSSRGFSLVEVVVAMGLLTVVSLGVAQLFALSTRANLIARGRRRRRRWPSRRWSSSGR